MSIVIDGVEKRIGSALSGGGFRAAAFHLGVMRRLRSLVLTDLEMTVLTRHGGALAEARLRKYAPELVA